MAPPRGIGELDRRRGRGGYSCGAGEPDRLRGRVGYSCGAGEADRLRGCWDRNGEAERLGAAAGLAGAVLRARGGDRERVDRSSHCSGFCTSVP